MAGKASELYLPFDGVRGINQSRDIADPRHELENAVNVWAPNGRVERRPGYKGLNNIFQPTYLTSAVATVRLYDAPTDAYINSLNVGASIANDIGDMMYVGYTTKFDMVQFGINTPPSNSVYTIMEYWNGTRWAALEHTHLYSAAGTLSISDYPATFCNDTVIAFTTFARPNDWAATVIDSLTKYWVRFTYKDYTGANDPAALDFNAVSAIDATSDAVYNYIYKVYSTNTFIGNRFITLGALEYPISGDYLCRPAVIISEGRTVAPVHIKLQPFVEYRDDQMGVRGSRTVPTSAVGVYSTDEVFFTYGEACGRIDYKNLTADYFADFLDAQVETADFAVGRGAPYDRTIFAQLDSWPQTKFIALHQNRLWAVTDTGVRQSAPVPYHKVWPALAYEPLEHDDTETTAAVSFNENLVIFKRNSIYRMVFAEFDTFQTPHFIPQLVVSGMGCVAADSIQAVNNVLLFLAEDGLYKFDGSSVAKVSDRNGTDVLANFWRSVNDSSRTFATSVNWNRESLYLLSVPTGNSEENDTTLVWDYASNTFWLWRFANNPISWFLDSSKDSSEELYFVDKYGALFHVGYGDSDHGATISCEMLSQPFGRDTHQTLRARDVFVTETNKGGDLTVEVIADDQVERPQSNTYHYDNDRESHYGVAKFDEDEFEQETNRVRRKGFNIEGKQLQVKLTHAARGTDFKVSNVELGVLPMGKR